MGRPVDQWDDWFIYHVVSKLDIPTREDWEKSLDGKEDYAKFDDLVNFLEKRLHSLEAAQNFGSSTVKSNTGSSNSRSSTGPAKGTNAPSKRVNANIATKGKQVSNGKKRSTTCILCEEAHYVSRCPKFKAMTVDKRTEFINNQGRCFNCFALNHSAFECPNKLRCFVCNAANHTQLHKEKKKSSSSVALTSITQTTNVETVSPANSVLDHTASVGRTVLLAMALVTLQSATGQAITARHLLVPGAEESFTSEFIVQALGLSKKPINVTISGVGASRSAISTSMADFILKSPVQKKFELSFSALVLDKLTSRLLSQEVIREDWPHIKGLQLADPHFHRPGRIDCMQ